LSKGRRKECICLNPTITKGKGKDQQLVMKINEYLGRQTAVLMESMYAVVLVVPWWREIKW
jgi:hypothetical protein